MDTDINFRRKQIKCCEGLHYSFELLDINFTTLYDKCIGIPENTENNLFALTQGWFIVDLVHRIREISQTVPGLSHNEPKLKNFLRETKVAEDFRHYIQHLRAELTKSDLIQTPVWGTLSWIDPEDKNCSYIAITGSRLENTSYPGCTFDIIQNQWISRVCLCIGDFSFDFDLVYEATQIFKEFIYSWMKNSLGIEIKKNQKLPILKTFIQPTTKGEKNET